MNKLLCEHEWDYIESKKTEVWLSNGYNSLRKHRDLGSRILGPVRDKSYIVNPTNETIYGEKWIWIKKE